MRESANWLLPSTFRNSRSYSIFIQQNAGLRLQRHWWRAQAVGAGPADPASELSDEEKAAQDQAFLARKTVGNLLDMSALATFHVSPLTVLAIFSDMAYGSRHYLDQLSERLKQQHIIDENTTIDNASDLLGALERASASAVGVFDKPPISLDGLRKTIDETKNAILEVDRSNCCRRLRSINSGAKSIWLPKSKMLRSGRVGNYLPGRSEQHSKSWPRDLCRLGTRRHSVS